jgi:hypothetical protein
MPLDLQAVEFGVEIMDDRRLQVVERDAAGAHHFCGMIVVDQCVEQMFERRIFMVTFRSGLQSVVEGLFEAFRKGRHGHSSPCGDQAGEMAAPWKHNVAMPPPTARESGGQREITMTGLIHG